MDSKKHKSPTTAGGSICPKCVYGGIIQLVGLVISWFLHATPNPLQPTYFHYVTLNVAGVILNLPHLYRQPEHFGNND